jgi:hypothetical protein
MSILLFKFDQFFMLLIPFLIMFRHGSQLACCFVVILVVGSKPNSKNKEREMMMNALPTSDDVGLSM